MPFSSDYAPRYASAINLTVPMSLLRLSRVVAAIFLIALFWMTARSAPVSVDAIPVSEDYVLRTWEVDDGLPNNNVSAITQTPDGYLWIATGGGLARFDGMRFTTFLKDSTPGLVSNRVLRGLRGAGWRFVDRA
jgi:hypothetical protein